MVFSKISTIKRIVKSLFKKLEHYNQRVKAVEQLIDRDIKAGKTKQKDKQNLFLRTKKGLMKDFFGGFMVRRRLKQMTSLRESLGPDKKPDNDTCYKFNRLIKTLYPGRKDLLWNWP